MFSKKEDINTNKMYAIDGYTLQGLWALRARLYGYGETALTGDEQRDLANWLDGVFFRRIEELD